MAGFWSRVTGSEGASDLQKDLRKITEEDKIDAPKDELLSVVQASHNADDRREIMRHLHGCLKEDSGKRWRRIHGGLVLVEHLLQKGSPQLVAETAEGHHFDLVQRLTFLEGFEHDQDKRVQHMVRSKAGQLRQEMLRKLDDAEEAVCEAAPPLERAAGSGAARSSAEERDVVDTAWHGVPLPDPNAKPASNKGLTVNGLVSVGHKDDTTSDESEGERREAPAARKKASSGGGRKESESRRRNVVDESTDSDSSGGRRRRRAEKPRSQAASDPPAKPAVVQDLLDF